ncbi:ribosome biogenesis regulatory protein-domain-containing protein [Microdochium trichocladiopsis]|uniref:Ribosome biogenesis regulatory protein n=1 Tax=Microdochium trichocladiopsis TaxID=1682393 RepID=A0A9P8YAG8_9PEZI|nr:ribosome biogenesis regulatory protein-domain-containing protein [Microdochium trichocladiopsis]KAH7034806.1 ribosome biogenesis regulatory protein-domain-containing protein [Microdochium trichocladiopsis]
MAPTAVASKPKLEVSVDRPTPYTFDLGILLANDPNPISAASGTTYDENDQPITTTTTSSGPAVTTTSEAKEAQLAAVARDAAQSLINQLLTTCPLHSAPQGVLLTLPHPTTPMPREKPLPPPKQPTKWELFAARKGIKPKTREQRRMRNQVFNEQTGEYERSWGFDAKAHHKKKEEGIIQQDWLVELKGDGKGGAAGGAGADKDAEGGSGKPEKVRKVKAGGKPFSNKKRKMLATK